MKNKNRYTVIYSCGWQNYIAARIYQSRIKRSVFLDKHVDKMDLETVVDAVLDLDSEFRKQYKKSLKSSLDKFEEYLATMKDEYDNDNEDDDVYVYFKYDAIKDTKMRKVISQCASVEYPVQETGENMNDKDVLVVDDSDLCTSKLIEKYFAPHSLTILSMPQSFFNKAIQENSNVICKIMRKIEVIKFSQNPPKPWHLRFKETVFFHPNGNKWPGFYMLNGPYLHECSLNWKKFTYNTALRSGEYSNKDCKGGIIVFPNHIIPLDFEAQKYALGIEQITSAFRQVLKRKIHLFGKSNFVGTYSIGHSFYGNYKEDYGRFDHNSITLDINGLSTKSLLRLSKILLQTFDGSSFLIKDLNNDDIYYIR